MAGLAKYTQLVYLLRYVPKDRDWPTRSAHLAEDVFRATKRNRRALRRLSSRAHAMMAHVPSISSSIASSGPGARLCFNRGAIAERRSAHSSRRRVVADRPFRSRLPRTPGSDRPHHLGGRKRRVVRPPGAPRCPTRLRMHWKTRRLPERRVLDLVRSSRRDARPTSRGARSDVASTDAARASARATRVHEGGSGAVSVGSAVCSRASPGIRRRARRFRRHRDRGATARRWMLDRGSFPRDVR